MNKYYEIAKNVLQAIGGKENVSFASHCMTRLRLNLVDDSIPKDEEIKKIDGVLGVVRTGGQYQVIIGQAVTKVYEQLCEIGGFQKTESIKENLDQRKKEKLTLKKIGTNIMGYMSGSITPLIPAIITGAMFQTIAIILGPSMLNLISAKSDMYILCQFMYNAIFYFLPIFIGFTAAKKLGVNQIMGAMLGAALIVPGFVSMVGTRTTFSIYGIFSAPVAKYGQTVLPIILSVWLMSYVERFFKKIMPEILSTIFTPFLTMLVMVPVAFSVCAPMGSWIGSILGNGLIWFGNHGGFLAVAVVGALWGFLVLTGMHSVIGLFGLTILLEKGSEFFVRPAAACATWAAFGLALGAFLKIKNKKEKALALGYFVSGILGGVTEPALYGVAIKYKKPFISLMLGGFVGGLYAGIMHVGIFAPGATNFLSVLGFANGGTANFVNGIIACVISLLVTAISTYLLGGFEAAETNSEV